MKARFWQVSSRPVGLGSQFDKHVGRKDGPQKEAVSLSRFIYLTLKTFIRESSTFSFPRGEAEPRSKTPRCLLERECSHLQIEGLGLLGPQVSHRASLLLKRVEVGHWLLLGTRIGCSQQEVWIPVIQSGGSHGNVMPLPET